MAIGEIFIGGCGVARGYLNEAEKDETKFIIDNNFCLYRSGDLAKRLYPNGPFIFLGRKDQQIKINGIRVDLLEICNCIKNELFENFDLKVHNSIVQLEQIDKNQSNVLVAYLTFFEQKEEHLNNEELIKKLRINLKVFFFN